MDEIKIVINDSNSNITIKEFLKKCNVGRGKIEQIRVDKTSFINGVYKSLETKLSNGDILSFSFEEKVDFVSLDLPIDIVYEDKYLLAVNKPVDMIIHPDDKSKTGTLVNLVANYYKKNNINRKVRFLHRIDKETTGIVLFAKDFLSESIMLKEIENHNISKIYLALVEGKLSKNEGVINANISSHRHINGKMCVSNNGKETITNYKVIKEFNDYSLVEFSLLTGRTHQIRVHSSYLNHPLLGDVLYGGNLKKIGRVALHSYKMIFTHPITNREIVIECPLPYDMKNLL